MNNPDETLKRSKRPPSITCGDNGGISSHTGKPCKNSPKKGRKWYKFHRGCVPRGVEHYKWKGGLTAVVPSRIAEKLERLAADQTIYDIRHDLAGASARVEELFSQFASTATAAWEELDGSFASLEAAVKSGDVNKFMPALEAHGKLIRQGLDEDVLWNKIERARNHRLSIIDRERKWMLDAGQMITAERLAMLGTELLHIIRSRVKDEGTLAAISNDIGMLMDRGSSNGNGQDVEPGGDDIPGGPDGRDGAEEKGRPGPGQ